MDNKLIGEIRDGFRLNRQPFIYNERTSKKLQKDFGRGYYHKFELDLSTARTNEKIEFFGDHLTVENCPNACSIRLNHVKNSSIDLQLIDEIEAPFRSFYVTNAASSGTLKLLTGSQGMFYAKKKINKFADDEKLYFGTGDDVTIYWDGSALIFNPASGVNTAFDFNPNNLTMYGGTGGGDDLLLRANTANNQAKISILGNSSIILDVDGASGVYCTFDGTYGLTVAHASNVTTINGGAVSGDDLILKSNSADTYPTISLAGDGNLVFNVGANKDILLKTLAENNLVIDGGTDNVTINGTGVSANYDLGLIGDGVLMLKETTTPTADTNYGKIYCKNDDKLYWQDGAGNEHEIAHA